MIKLGNQIINADMMDIVQGLRQDLLVKGIERFKDIKPNGNNIQVTCPFHKSGQERKPSFGINIHDGKCHCFTCGWNGNISSMIGQIFYKDEQYGLNWLVRHFSSTEVETRQRLVDLPTNKRAMKVLSSIKEVGEDITYNLDKYRYIHPYMYKRGLTDELIEKFDIGYDKFTDCITFPVYDTHNQLKFVGRRSVKGKMYKYPPNVEKPVYAMNFVDTRQVYIVESVFNCWTLWKLGLQAVALLGTGTQQQYEVLKNSNVRTFIIALDPDEAGVKGTIRLRKALGRYKQLKEVKYVDTTKDINDLQEQFLDLKIVF